MTRPLRVLFFEPSALVSGGGIALLRFVSKLDKRAFRPLVVLGSDGPLVPQFRRVPGCRVVCRPLPLRLSRVTRFRVITGGLANLPSAVAYGLTLRAIADRWNADIVHSNGLKTHVFSILTICRSRRVLVWHLRDLLSPSYMPLRSTFLMRSLIRLVPDVTICNSEATCSALRATTAAFVVPPGFVPERHARPLHAVVFDGIQCDDNDALFRTEHRPTGKRVLMLGRIAEWKGQHVFVRAAQRLCAEDGETEFIIAGGATTAADAAYERRLRAAVESFGLSHRIVFAGVVADVPRLLGTVDLVVHCSTSPEPFGQVVIEAMAASVPVVATNMGGPAEIIRDRFNGRLYPAGDDSALADIIRALLADPVSRQQLGVAARATVEERFGIERTTSELAGIYRHYANHAGAQ